MSLREELLKEKELIKRKISAIDAAIEVFEGETKFEYSYGYDVGKKLSGVLIQVVGTFDSGKPRLTKGDIYAVEKVSEKGLGIRDDANRLRWFTVKNVEVNNFKFVK